MKAERIATGRLVLRPLDETLARSLATGDFSVVAAGDGWPYDATRGVASMAIAGSPTWLITHDGAAIGECSVKGSLTTDGSAEIGYGLAEPWRGRGYGTEAIGGLTKWLTATPECRRISAEVHETNMPSRRLLERLGFTLERCASPYVWYERF